MERFSATLYFRVVNPQIVTSTVVYVFVALEIAQAVSVLFADGNIGRVQMLSRAPVLHEGRLLHENRLAIGEEAARTDRRRLLVDDLRRVVVERRPMPADEEARRLRRFANRLRRGGYDFARAA